jgi:hypothetical protein
MKFYPIIGDEVSHLYDIPKCSQYFKELLVEKVAPPKRELLYFSRLYKLKNNLLT